MKKLIIIASFILLLTGCYACNTCDADGKCDTSYSFSRCTQPSTMFPQTPSASYVYDSELYASDYDRFVQNVHSKTEGDNFVIYEYKDVRIDELKHLAIMYCKQKGFYGVNLCSITNKNNYAKIARFDCQNLQ